MNEENVNTNTSVQPETQKKKFRFKLPKAGNAKLKVNLKALFAVFGVLLLAFAVYAAKGFFVSAVVNGQPISRFKIIQELERRNGQQVLEGLVNQTLLEQEGKKRGIIVTDEELATDIKVIEDNMKAQGTTLEDALLTQNLTMTEFRTLLKTNKVLEKIIADKVAVTDEEVKNYFESNKASFPEGSTIENVKDQIQPFLQQQKVDVESEKLFKDLRAQSKVYFWKKY